MALQLEIAATTERENVQAKKALVSAFFGFLVDMFDVFLPIIVLAPAYAYFQPPSTPQNVASLAASLVTAATLLGRPLGSIIFGYFSDKIGRRPVTMIAVAGFGTCTLLMGVLPGYATWGAASLYSLILLRFICGVFLGGEYTAANVLAMEAAPKEKRGLYSGLIQAGYPVAYVLIALLAFSMLQLFPIAGGLDSPYIAYGWRIPFFIGGLLALGFVLPFRASVHESDLWEKASKKENPIKAVLSGETAKHFMQAFVLLTGFWLLTISTAAGILPQTLIRIVHLTPQQMTIAMMVASIVLIPGYVFVGAFSQMIGRRAMMIVMGLLSGTIGIYCYYRLLSLPDSFSEIVMLSTLVVVINTSVWGLATCYLNERFPTRTRSSGFGMAFTLPVILPSFFGFYQEVLSRLMPGQYTVLVLVGVGAALTIVGALLGSETKDVNFERLA
jgi:MFS family permease